MPIQYTTHSIKKQTIFQKKVFLSEKPQSSIILSIVLSLPITVWAVDDADIESTNLEQPLTVSQLEEDADSIE